MQQRTRLIDLRGPLKTPLRRRLFKLVEPPIEKLLSVRSLNRTYSDFIDHYDHGNFFASALDHLNVRVDVSEEDRGKIPASGPLVVVANHPFGGIDGIVLGALLTSVRQDVKILANHFLNHVPEIRPWLIPVDPYGGEAAARSNTSSVKLAIRWVREGGALAVFPAGEVSRLHLAQRRVTDPAWSLHAAALPRKTEAPVVPVYFDGRNSNLFQVLGLVHWKVRTALLPHEFINKTDSTIRVRVGKPIPPRKLSEFSSDREIIEYLRLMTYIMKRRNDEPGRGKRFFLLNPKPTPRLRLLEPLAEAASPEDLRGEVESLPLESRLTSQGECSVHIAKTGQIPKVLQEIGRLREKTFREVGEGTGRPSDLDAFDEYYLHLFMWDHAASRIVGAYRLGLTDVILERYGIEGLYTSTLFDFKPDFSRHFNPAVELGRSFICSDYQKKHVSLSLMWKGIGEFVVRSPRYNILFGPVSISEDYNALSRNLMIQFLKRRRMDGRFAGLVRAKNPLPPSRFKGLDRKTLESSLKDIDEVSALVSEIETDQKGVPVLLRQYLKLNGNLLSFNVDEDFSRVVDGLIRVDLTATSSKLLKRYMGAEGLKRFLAYHGM